MRALGSILAFTLIATAAGAQSSAVVLRATGEHRVANGDTLEAARQLALVDADHKAFNQAAAQLQSRAEVKALGLTPGEVEAFAAVILEPQEQPAPAPLQISPGSPVRVSVQVSLDMSDVVRRLNELRRDQDASHAVTLAWGGIRQLRERLAANAQKRSAATSEQARPLIEEHTRMLTALEVKELAIRAMAAMVRTEERTVGGRAPSPAGRDRARQLAATAAKLSPDSPDARSLLGDLLVDALSPEEAEVEYRKALAGEPDSSFAHVKLAEALRLQGNFAEAAAALREAIRLEPGSARAHNDIALVLRAEDKLQESIAEYREAIRLDPDLMDAHNGLAVALAGQGKMEEAVAEFKEIVRIDPDSTIGYYNLAFALAELDRDVESAAALREVIRVNPNHYNARYNLGELFRMEGKFDDSARQFREYLRLAPDTPQNQRNIKRASGFVEQFEER
jgi:tetratricopeptide (TPR) repeat protein